MSNITHTTAVRTALSDAVVGSAGQLGANGKLVIYSGAMPANAQASLSGNVAVATITGVSFGAASAGTSTVTASTSDPSAVGGVAAFFRVTTSGGTVVFQGDAGTSGTDLVLNTTAISAGAIVSLAGTNSYSAPL